MFFEKMFVVFKCSENSVNHKTIFNKMCVSYQWEDLYSRKGGWGMMCLKEKFTAASQQEFVKPK